jgi:hypothetical protein
LAISIGSIRYAPNWQSPIFNRQSQWLDDDQADCYHTVSALASFLIKTNCANLFIRFLFTPGFSPVTAQRIPCEPFQRFAENRKPENR